MKLLSIILVTCVVFLATAQGVFLQGRQMLIATPNPQGHPEFIRAIQGARQSIFMTMFHLTDPQVVNALIAAKGKGRQVRVLLDRAGLNDPRRKAFADQLIQNQVEVRPSSPAFTITHEKAMIIDNNLAFITAINLTDNASTTRDFGLILDDPAVIKEMSSVFEADWINAANQTGNTPPLSNPNLVWSPINSDSKLTNLILSAKQTVVSTVENLGDTAIMNAFIAAAQKGRQVRLIVPMCDKNSDPAYNYRFIPSLVAGKVNVRVMPAPASPTQPYMHSKMILIDNAFAYVGSINFSVNSTQHARELGIIFGIQNFSDQISRIFEMDWSHAVVPGAPPTRCPPLQ